VKNKKKYSMNRKQCKHMSVTAPPNVEMEHADEAWVEAACEAAQTTFCREKSSQNKNQSKQSLHHSQLQSLSDTSEESGFSSPDQIPECKLSNTQVCT
jgi:hypothetical protein